MSNLARFRRNFDAGYLVVLAISLIALWPFLSRSGLPQETDAELHVFRLAELTRLVTAGELYPRWAPHFYYGYGYPIFNYYAPLTYYLGLALDLLSFVNAVQAVKILFVLGLLAGGLGSYGFVRDNWGRPAALVAAALYLYAPYIQYVDPHARGALAESFSFGLFPLALLALDRLRRQPGAWRFLSATLLIAALILTHNLMGVVFFGLLSGWVVWHVLGSWRQDARSNANTDRRRPSTATLIGIAALRGHMVVLSPNFLAGLSLVLAVTLSAFFWLPVILERDAVNLSSLVGNGGNFDFRTHFLSLRTLLSPSQRLDWGATEPDFAFNLGLAQWALGLVGVIFLLAGRLRNAWQATYFALALLLLLFLMLPVSTFIWERVPGLPFLQFPWRLLGPAAALLAILAGAGVERLLQYPSFSSAWVIPGFIGLIMILGLPLSQVPPWPPDFGSANTRQLMEIELQGRWLGTTSTADFVPVTVEKLPTPVDSLLDALREGTPLDPVNRASLPDGTRVETETITPLHQRFQVQSEKPFLLRLFIFNFPGWRVTVDGQPARMELGRPEGFIVVPLAAGRHEVELFFGTTPARRLGWQVSGTGLLLMLLLAVVIGRRARRATSQNEVPEVGHPGTWQRTAVFVLLVTAAHLLILQPAGWLHYDSNGFQAIPAEQDLFVNFGDQVALIGYDTSIRVVQTGEVVTITLYWKALVQQNINFQAFLHLLSEDGTLVAQSDKLNPGEYPTRRWPLDQYVRDVHRLALPQELPAGLYTVSAGLWVQSEGWRLPVLNAAGEQVGDNTTLFRLEVVDHARD